MPLSTPENVKVAARLSVVSGGFSTMSVSGGFVSMPLNVNCGGRRILAAGTVDRAHLERVQALLQQRQSASPLDARLEDQHRVDGLERARGSGASVRLVLDQPALVDAARRSASGCRCR